MTNEVSKNLRCVVMRNGIEIWIEGDRLVNLFNALKGAKESKFLEFDGRVMNTADISGVFLPEDMKELYDKKKWKYKKDTLSDEELETIINKYKPKTI